MTEPNYKEWSPPIFGYQYRMQHLSGPKDRGVYVGQGTLAGGGSVIVEFDAFYETIGIQIEHNDICTECDVHINNVSKLSIINECLLSELISHSEFLDQKISDSLEIIDYEQMDLRSARALQVKLSALTKRLTKQY